MTEEERKERRRESARRYRENNREKVRESQRKYRENNPDVDKIYYKNNKLSIDAKNKQYYEENKDAVLQYTKNYYEENKDKIKEVTKIYYEKNKDKICAYVKEYRKKNKEKVAEQRREYEAKSRKTNPLFKLKENVKTNIRNSFNRNGYTKKSKTNDILGCTFEEFKTHMESQFESWMNWDNRGLYNGELNYGWDIDHIIPLATAKTEEDIIRLNHYTNLQPLCSYINRVVKKDN